MSDLRVKVCRVNPDAKLPAYAKPGDAGMDLATPVDVLLVPGVPVLVDTGVAFAIPTGYEGQVRVRSGLGKRGVIACGGIGTIDSGYRNTVGVVLLLGTQQQPGCAAFDVFVPPERRSENIQLRAGDRIAQLVIARVPSVELDEVATIAELGETERGMSGYGSTGR